MSRFIRPSSRHVGLAGVVGLIAITLIAFPGAVVARQEGPWRAAVLEAGVNSAQADGCPIESPNGLNLYFASTRPGAVGGSTDPNDIWRVHRTAIDAPWGEPEHLPAPVNSAALTSARRHSPASACTSSPRAAAQRPVAPATSTGRSSTRSRVG